MDPRFDLINYSMIESTSNNTILFDEMMDIFDKIMNFLETHNLKLKYDDKNIFFIKLIDYLYENSSKNKY